MYASSDSTQPSQDVATENVVQLTSVERASHLLTTIYTWTQSWQLSRSRARLNCRQKLARAGCTYGNWAEAGMQDDTRRPLNLTQLLWNERKKSDSTCGRKRPSADDVDVVPAGDADPDVAETLVEAINNVSCTICVWPLLILIRVPVLAYRDDVRERRIICALNFTILCYLQDGHASEA